MSSGPYLEDLTTKKELLAAFAQTFAEMRQLCKSLDLVGLCVHFDVLSTFGTETLCTMYSTSETVLCTDSFPVCDSENIEVCQQYYDILKYTSQRVSALEEET